MLCTWASRKVVEIPGCSVECVSLHFSGELGGLHRSSVRMNLKQAVVSCALIAVLWLGQPGLLVAVSMAIRLASRHDETASRSDQRSLAVSNALGRGGESIVARKRAAILAPRGVRSGISLPYRLSVAWRHKCCARGMAISCVLRGTSAAQASTFAHHSKQRAEKRQQCQ